MPYLHAANCPTVTYLKIVVTTYLDQLIAWRDCRPRQDRIESAHQTTQLHILAAEIRRGRPTRVSLLGNGQDGLATHFRDAASHETHDTRNSQPRDRQLTKPGDEAVSVVVAFHESSRWHSIITLA